MLSIPSKYHEFIRFGLVGVINTGVHAGIVILLMETLLPPAYIANGIAFMFANGISYCINSRWTFRTTISFRGYRRFLLVSLLSLALTLLITSLAEHLGLHYGIGLLLVVFMVPVLNYLAVRVWAFAPESL